MTDQFAFPQSYNCTLDDVYLLYQQCFFFPSIHRQIIALMIEAREVYESVQGATKTYFFSVFFVLIRPQFIVRLNRGARV